MKVYEEILQRLRNGEPLEQVRKNYRSAFQFVMVLRIYSEELSAESERRREALKQEKAWLKEAVADRKQIGAEKKLLETDVHELREERKALTIEVQSLRREADEHKTAVAKLETQGYTKKVMARLKHTSVKNEDEALLVLCDQQTATEVRTSVQCLKIEEAASKDSVISLKLKEQRLAGKLASKKNTLDSVKSQISVIQKVTDVVEAAFRRRYAPGDLISILVWLEKMEIQKQPQQSIQRLIELFAEAKGLSKLKQDKIALETEVMKLRTTRSTIEADIEFQKVLAERALEEQVESNKETLKSVATQFKEEVSQTISEMAEKMSAASEILDKSKNEPVRLLYAMIQSPEILDAIPPPMMIVLMENLTLWCERHFHNADVAVVYDVAANEFRFNDFAVPRFRVSALIKLAAEAIRKLISQRLRGHGQD